MRASPMPIRMILTMLFALSAWAAGLQQAHARENHIAAELVVERPARAGETVMLALHFRPEKGWHGYWLNPGDAGYGMELAWSLPDGATAGEPEYPVPDPLVIGGLMNHVYEADYAVLVPLTLPNWVEPGDQVPVMVKADWLACSDKLCVPESGTLAASIAIGAGPRDPRFDKWIAAIPPVLETKARFALNGDRLRVAIPLPADVPITQPHLFVGTGDLVDYVAPQSFFRKGNWLIADMQAVSDANEPDGEVSGILRTRPGEGFAFNAQAGVVPDGGVPVIAAEDRLPAIGWLILAALAGGLLLNLMPCVFPILSLKALSLARAGESARQARLEGLAYTAGTVLATLALGVLLLVLRAGGEQVGWAFQLQEPGVVVGLLLLAVAITANFAGLFELPGLSIARGGDRMGAFATGLLAAFVATPCTGPFMAAALGAALLLPPLSALSLFAALGLGLALPFLLLGFVPPLRRMLPRPGPWMERFRHWMAVPMGLTALALLWLASRLGGMVFAGVTLLVAFGLLAALWLLGRRQKQRRPGLLPFALLLAGLASISAIALPAVATSPTETDAGLLEAQPFSESALDAARKSGKPVFVWFTADWCITCKVNEGVAIEREAVREAFARRGVIAIKGDWTRRDPMITRFLTAQGAAGVPLYLWYEPGATQPERLPQLLEPDALVRLAARQVRPASPADGTP